MDYRFRLTIIGVLWFTLYHPQLVQAQGGDFEKQVDIRKLPIPKEPHQLFYLQKDPDANTVIYQLNVKNNKVDPKRPVNAYWKQYEEGGRKKALNYVQKTMAYGIQAKAIDEQTYSLELVSYKKLPLTLSYSSKHKKHVVTTQINGRKAVLEQIFVRIIGGTVFNPQIQYYLLKGRDYENNTLLEEELIP